MKRTDRLQSMPDAEALMQLLLQQRITRESFKLGITQEQAVTLLKAAVMSEVAFRRRQFRDSRKLTEYVNRAARWLTTDGKVGLLLCGVPGNGKTTLMNAIRRAINYCDVRRDYDNRSVTMMQIDAKEICWLNKNEYKDYKALCRREMLAIDDLGLEPTEVLDFGNVLNPVIDLLSIRYDEQLMTVVTTNLTPKQIREKYGARIADRFNEMMEVVIFENETYRTQ